MSAAKKRTVRRHKQRTDDGKGLRRMIAGRRFCHGIPHKGDRLLYKHYANRPWGGLFESQRQFRDHLRPVFDCVPDLLEEYDPLQAEVEAVWSTGERKIGKIADSLGVSDTTVRRRLKTLKNEDEPRNVGERKIPVPENEPEAK